MATLNELKKEENTLLEQLRENKANQREILISNYTQETGLKLGDKVSIGKRSGVIIRFSTGNKVRPVIKLYDENGKLTSKLLKLSPGDKVNKI